MTKIKKLIALGLSAILITSLTACNNNTTQNTNNSSASTNNTADSNNSASSAENTINYANCSLTFSWWGDESRNNATLAAIDAFEAKYPGITINESFGTWSGWEESVASQFKSKTESDINQIDWSWIHTYGANGDLFLDLNLFSDVIDLNQFPTNKLLACSIDGALQAVPVSMSGKVFYWNKTMFEKAGISVPSSLDELMDAGKIFKEKLGKDYYPLVLDANDRMSLMIYYMESVYGKTWVEFNTLNYTVEELKKGLEFIQTLENNHVIPSMSEVDEAIGYSLADSKGWQNGKYAGVFIWDYDILKYEPVMKNGHELVAGAPLSDMGDNKGGFSKINMAYSISKNCKNPKEAALFIDFMLNQNEGVAAIGAERGVPLSKSAFDYCNQQGLLNPILLEANRTILDYASFEIDPKFESAELTDSNGVYYDVMAGLSYEAYDSISAAETLFNGIKNILSK